MIKEVIVVEGKSDTAAIHRAVEADTIETGGSAINKQILSSIALAQNRRGVIIFTDPDHAGERLRKIISSKIAGCKHAFVTREDADYKGDIGVENATIESIRYSLQNLRTEYVERDSQIPWEALLLAGLIHHPSAAARRLSMGNILGIGYCNGKQFYKRCKVFQISLNEFQAALHQINKRGL